MLSPSDALAASLAHSGAEDLLFGDVREPLSPQDETITQLAERDPVENAPADAVASQQIDEAVGLVSRSPDQRDAQPRIAPFLKLIHQRL